MPQALQDKVRQGVVQIWTRYPQGSNGQREVKLSSTADRPEELSSEPAPERVQKGKSLLPADCWRAVGSIAVCTKSKNDRESGKKLEYQDI